MKKHNYDFRYELQRLVEQMQPRDFRTFRTEFNISSTTETNSYSSTTTHYTQSKYIQPKSDVSSTTRVTITSPTTNGKTHDTVDNIKNQQSAWGTTMQFSEIRSLKRIHKVHEGIGTENIIDTPGILHPSTGEILTVGDAIKLRILDVRTGRIVSSTDGSTSMTIQEAARNGLIRPELAERLSGPCGVTEDGRNVSLLEAIQRELYDAEHSDPSEKRIKVETSGQLISDALSDGKIDEKSGTFVLENGNKITIQEAYEQGHLVLKEIKVKTSALSLSDIINQGLIDDRTGWIIDRNSGDKCQIDVAIKHGIINPNIREVIDPKKDTKITLQKALELGVINQKLGKYIYNHEKLSLQEARRRQLIMKPMTLKDICDLNLLDNQGTISTPIYRNKVSIIEAISRGILDADNIKCITNTKTNDLITLSEALSSGIILPDSHFKDALTGEICTIPEAVDRGLITSVSVRSIFDIEGFKDPSIGEFISLNSALAKGLISPKNNGSIVVDSQTGKLVPLHGSLEEGLVREEILDMLNRPIGMFENSKELTVLDAVLKRYIDPKTGQILDIRTKRPISMNTAIEKEIITPEGAVLLNSLLSITVTTQTISKTIKRYVTITNTGTTKSEYTITFGEAIRRGLIDETTQTFQNPENGSIIPIEQALSEGLISTDAPSETFITTKAKSPIKITRITSVPQTEQMDVGDYYQPSTSPNKTLTKTDSITSSPSIDVEFSSSSPTKFWSKTDTTFSSPTSELQSTPSPIKCWSPDVSITSPSKFSSTKKVVSEFLTHEKQVYELPPDGWLLSEAIDQQLLDPVTGLFIIRGTDRLVSFEECIKLRIINPQSAVVIDPQTNRETSIQRSLDKQILDKTGHYRIDPDKYITMFEAISQKLIILKNPTQQDLGSQRLIQVTKIYGKPDLVEVSSNVIDKNPPTFVKVKSTESELSSLEPLQIQKGVIYDPSTALVIFTESGKSENLIEAIKEKKIDPNLVSVKDPHSGKEMPISDAIRKGIINKDNGEYKDKSGRKISLNDAAKFGVLAVVGAPLIAAQHVVKIVKKSMIFDPKTGEQLPIEVAFERGLVDKETIEKYEAQTQDPEYELFIKDPQTNTKISSKEAIEKGIISPSELKVLEKLSTTSVIRDPITDEVIPMDKALETGLISPKEIELHRNVVQISSPTIKTSMSVKDPETGKSIPVEDAIEKGIITEEEVKILAASKPQPTRVYEEKVRPTAAERTRSRITTEPTYKVAIGCARQSQSPDREAKPVILQKMRRKIVKPKDATDKGLIDAPTAEMLTKTFEAPGGENLTLGEAILNNKLDGNQGHIKDPQSGDILTINEAISRGILDPNGTNQLLLPLNRSLSIPALVAQGLVDPQSSKIIHPETGDKLSLREAIVCDIVDPLSNIENPVTGTITLEEAINLGHIDDENSAVVTSEGPLDLLTAVEVNIFKDEPQINSDIPPAGMTLPVALKRGLIDPETNEVIHPLTGERMSIEKAIEQNFIMALPYPENENSVDIKEALKENLIKYDEGTYTDKQTGEVIPINEAINKGLLVVKALPTLVSSEQQHAISVTKTVTSYHTITTKTVELLAGYALISATEVKNLETNEVIPIEEAKKRGIVKDEKETKEHFTTKESKTTFSEALKSGLIDLDNGTYTDPQSGTLMPISEAIQLGHLDANDNEHLIMDTSDHVQTANLNIIDAFETIYDDKTQSFKDPENTHKLLTFTEAIEREIVDPNSIIYNTTTSEPLTVKQAIEKGVLDPKTGKFKDKQSGQNINIKDAAKMGLLAIVGAPILAGMAVADAVKNLADKSKSKKSEKLSPSDLTRSEISPEKVIGVIQPAVSTQDFLQKEIESTVTQKVKEPVSETPKLISYERLAIGDAISQRKIEPKICRILVNNKEMPLTVQDALDLNEVSPLDVVDIISKVKVSLVQEKPKYALLINQDLTPDQLIELGVFDAQFGYFTDPSTGTPITFSDLIYGLELFNPDNILVKDLTKPDHYLPLEEALAKPLIDKNTGHMVDPKTGKKVNFFDAVRLGYIIERSAKPRKPDPVPLPLDELLTKNIFNPETSEIIHPDTGEKIELIDAIDSGIVDPNSIKIRNPQNNQIITIIEAVELGIVDITRNVVINIETREEITLATAFKQGYLIAGPRKGISLEAAIRTQLYEPKSGTILDSQTNENINLEESVKRGIVNADISDCKDTRANAWIPLNEALDTKLVNSDNGKMRDTKTGNLVTLDVALAENMITTKPVQLTITEAITESYYSPKTGKILNPTTGESVTLKNAIDTGFIDPTSTRLKDIAKNKIVTVPEGEKGGIIDTNRGVLINPPAPLNEAFDKGYILSTIKPWSLQEALAQNVYDPATGLFTIDGKALTLDEAIKSNLINKNSLAIKNPQTNEIISLEEAIILGIIDPIKGVIIDATTNEPINLYEALDRGTILPFKRKFSLPEAIFKGFYDPKSGQFATPISTEKLSTDKAMRKGVVDFKSTVVCIDGMTLTFHQAVQDGIIDVKLGKVIGSDRFLDFQEAFEQGVLVEVRKPLSLSEALVKGLYDPQTNLFLDPQTGECITLIQALESGMIDPNSVHVRDTRDPRSWKQLTLLDAIKEGVVDGDKCTVKDPSKSIEFTISEAFDKGIITDRLAAVSLQRAIHQGLYDSKTGKFVDPQSERYITLHEAIRKFIINPLIPCYFDRKNQRLLNLVETCRSGIIDRRNGTFKEPGSTDNITLDEALNLGLIIDVETAGFGLYDVITMNLYDPKTGMICHPATNKKFTLNDSIKDELVNPLISIVKNLKTGKYILLNDAIEENIIDDQNGRYNLPNGNSINFLVAKEKGLIVTSHKPISVEEAIKNSLYRPEAGKFIDPTTGECHDISSALDSGLLDPNSTFLKDPVTNQLKSIRSAIEDGNIDVPKGRVLDSKTKQVYNFDVAFERNLLITVDQLITSQKRENLFDSPRKDVRKVRECSIQEAINFELLDPNLAVIKHPQNGHFITLNDAIADQLVDVTKTATFDPQNQSYSILFDQNLLVYKKKPYTFAEAIELGKLDITTSKFTDGDEVLTLKEAVTLGRIDPDTALIKDGLKKKLVKLPEAFRKGLIDAEKGNVLDTITSKLHSLEQAVNQSLLTTPRRGFTLTESLIFGLYNPVTGGFTDPFFTPNIIDRKRLTLGNTLETGLIDPSSTVIKDLETGNITPLVTAIDPTQMNLIDSVSGKYLDKIENKELDLVKALERGLILPAAARQAVEEKYRLCDDTLTKLLAWISQIESKLASQDVVKEYEEELRNQINIMKQIKDDLDVHNRQIAQCGDQVRQLVLTAGDILSKDEITSLEKNGRSLKQRYDRACDRTEGLLRRLSSARDELSKFRSDLNVFSDWLSRARRTLEDKERSLSDLGKLSSSADSTREFVSDVIAHKADLRFITMAAQKFVDESKEYLTVLNDFRTSLPERLPHVKPLSSQDSPVSNDLSVVTQQYRDLLNRTNALSDRLSGVGGKQRDYSDAVDKARRWLREVEPKVLKVLSEPVGAEPKLVEEQLNRAKTLNNEFLAQGRLIDNAKHAVSSLLRSLEGQLSPTEIAQLEQPVIELEDKYKQLGDALAEKCQELDTALVQSQGVQDALDGLVNWLNQAENQFKTIHRPASLNKERLEEQIREQRLLQADIDSHRPSVDSITKTAHELISNASNARVAKKIEQKLHDVKSRFDKLLDKSIKRGDALEEVHVQLSQFTVQVNHFEQWYVSILDIVESRDLIKLSVNDYTIKMQELCNRRDDKRNEFEDTVLKGRNLVGKKDVTDTVPVRDKIKSLESQWKDLNTLLDEKQKLSKQRSEQLSAYEKLRDQIFEWLTVTENKVSRLEVIAIDIDLLKRQNEELKPIIKEYRDYGVNIDKVNELGSIYDALLRGERPDSPSRRRSQAYSPTKRTSVAASPLRRLSQDGRSPSPTKGYQLTSPVSPGGSSGFSSRRSSQDGFHLDELSPVQQQLADINNRYSLLGVRLTDRQNEIDAIRDELRKHLDSLKTLSSFLEKVQRQMPKEFVPNTKEEADKTNKVYKTILEEMYEKQSLLDSTKSQVRDLLRRKPSAIGSDRLNDELEDVISLWKSLNDKCKDRIRFMDDIKDFHDTHDGLNSWLTAKDRMLTVLGPISSDSRMVQSQVQQVQVLREEFRGQQPQLQHLNDIGDSVLSSLIPNTPDQHKIANKLQTIQQKWADLLARLEERAESLGAAADTSREFDAGLARLRDALQAISDNLDDISLDKDPEEQLHKIENLERQLEGQRPLLADAEATGAQLCDVLSDPASRAEIQAKLAAVGRQYNTLQKKLDHRKAEIEGSLRDGRQFEASCARTLGWLSDELGALTDRLLISADRETLQQQVDHHEPVYRDVMAREHEVIMLLNKGRDILARSKTPTTGDSTRSLQRDIDKIQQHWDKLKKETVDRHTRLQTCLEHCRKYYKAQETFLPWLRQAEDKLDSLRPSSFKRKHMEQRLRELQQFRNDVWKKSGEYENNKMLGDTFLSACDIDKDIVKNELTNLKQRWDKLNNDLLERTQSLEDTSRRLGDFNESLRDLQHNIQRCEDRLASHDALGGAAKDPKLLERIKQLREEVSGLKKPLLTVRQSAQDLTNEAGEHGVDATHLLDEVDALGDRIEDLQGKLEDRCSELQSAATAVTQFNDKVKGLSHDLSSLENDLDAMKPPGRDIKTVRNQQDDIAQFINKIARAADDVNDAIRDGEVLVDNGFAPDTVQTRQQVDTLNRQIQKLDDRAKKRENDLQATLDRLQSFYEAHGGVLDDIQDASDQLRKFKPVGSEVEQIRSQQEDFRIFRTHTVEPLSQNVDECNRLGQSLIQSASAGVNTSALEKDLEKMNEKWNDLKGRMNERERRLDVALLQSGKFQEALDGLAQWLTDTEEMVANQKPPSADYKVVKAQLQEQKFLKKMLLDRQNSMSSLFTMGNEIAQGADPAERKAIEKQLKELMGRFDKLTTGAQQRTLDLEQAMHVAKKFHDKLIPLQEWLDKTEKTIKDMELVPTDEEKIQQRIREHEVVHDDILCKKPEFSDLTEIASNLMELVGEDEALGLGEKLQIATDRYTALVQASDNVGQLLTASRQGLRHLVLTYQDLVGWMDAMEDRLGRYRVLAVHTDRLLEQMDDLADLTEEISTRQSAVDGTVDSGLELMKHISSDEALQLKDKLDSLQRRFNDLTSRGVDLLKHAQEALPLVEQFHNAHNRLVDWMLPAEGILQHGDPREDDIARLELDIQELRPVLDTINLIGPKLCQISPGEGAATIESIVTRDNRRFDAIVEQIQRKAERINLSKQRSMEVTGDIDELLEWFREVDSQLRESDPPSAEPDLIRLQLKEHRALNDDISSQKGRVRDVLSTAKKVLRETSPTEDTSILREKMEDLREMMDLVSGLSSDRLGILEQALPLAEHFRETHVGLSAWLDDIEQQITMLAMPALRPDLIAQQQDRNEMFLQSINEHKPLVEKLNKTGEALIKLCNEEDGIKIQELLDQDNERYNAIKIELRERQQALEDALQESSQFSDKLEGMLRALSNTADQVKSADPISANVPKIEDQINENDALIGDLNKREEAYAAVKKAASDVLNKAGNRQGDPAIKDIKKKLEKLNNLWQDVQKATTDRGRTLDDALEAAKKFWKQLHHVMAVLKDLQDSLSSQEPPAVEPSKIQEQQVALQEIRQEIDQTKPEVDSVRESGRILMKLVGEPDKPEVKKHIEDLDSAWHNITALYAKREENLIDAMEKAMEFHETLQNLVEFLSKAEDRFSKMGPLGTDIDAVKKQIGQLKDFKTDVDPHMVKVEALNRQAQELTERTSADQAAAIKEPLSAVNRRWDTLLKAMVERQRQLENALLRLGQFQHALSELLVWIGKTDQTLDELKPILGDPQVLEIELAKLKVLINDIQAHQTSVETLNDAGRQIIESGKGTDEASTTQDKLSTLNRQWRDLVQKASDRQRELESALKDAHLFHAEIQDLLSWLADIDGVIAASKPVGGLPETASEQLERFMEIYNELEQNRPKVETVLQQGQEYLKKSQANTAMNLAQNLKTLKQRWENTTARANDKKIKLEIALKEATEFHDALQAFVDWLTNAEKVLSNLKPVSRVMETILTQIEEHKTFQKDVGVHRETMLNLDKKGTHLKYFSQKQDVILIKNLLISVQHRWERVVAKSAERTRALDHGYKEAREFHDSWLGLMNWLTDTEKSLDELNAEIGVNDPEKIKQRINKHREFQRALSSKQSNYDTTMKLGKQLKEKAPKTDEAQLKQQLIELKNKWTSVCSKSVDRQRKLEEALLYSGQFKDAIQALLDWLHKVEKQLAEDGPLHGDLDTVISLVDQHKHFEQDLQNRAAQMESVTRTGRELEAKANTSDATQIRTQLSQLNGLWDRVTSLTQRKSEKLEDALKEAERLHKSVHMLLEWLSDAEMRLRFAGPLPDDEQDSKNQLSEHESFLRELAEKEMEKDSTIALAQRILAKAHPDAVSVIKHWITIIQSRWEEVSTWAKQRQQRLSQHMQGLKDLDDTLEELLAWLQGLENTLTQLEAEELPDEIPPLQVLISDHQEFMENTSTRQPEVDRVCKARQIKPQSKESSPRKLSKPKTGVRGSQHDLQRETSPDLYGSLDRKQSLKGSRDHLAVNRKGSRSSPSRDFGGAYDGLPHYGPRFAPRGSKGTEPEFRSPRVKLLWDKWRHVWFMAWERQKRLHDKLMYLQELEKVRNFSWEEWRKRFLKFMNHKKSRLTDLFRKMDKDNNGLIPREDFIDGIIKTKFDTSRLEMNAVADLFDRNNCGLIDWKEFIARLRPDWEDRKPPTDADKIHDEVKRLVMLCTCRQKFRVFQVGEGKYRFGDSQKLRLVRILRSTVMVRVGGGWVALDEFLLKNDPCRAKGRTNIELREQFILADGVSQSMTAFKPKTPSSAQRNTSFSGSAGPITKVRERSSRSVPMGSTQAPRTSRSSLSAGTPDSLSDNESTTPGYARPTSRKGSIPIRNTPASSRPNSRPNSRPASRAGSKPPSRHGSTLSLDSTDDATPSKIPISRRTTSSLTTRTPLSSGVPSGAARKLTVPNGTPARPKTPTGMQSPSTPTSRARTPSTTGGGATTSSTSKLQRKGSGASDISTGGRKGVPTPIDQRAPFRS